MKTQMYFGDGVYGTFDGFQIELTANGVDSEATDSICLEPGMLDMLKDWRDGKYPDYNTGKPYEA